VVSSECSTVLAGAPGSSGGLVAVVLGGACSRESAPVDDGRRRLGGTRSAPATGRLAPSSRRGVISAPTGGRLRRRRGPARAPPLALPRALRGAAGSGRSVRHASRGAPQSGPQAVRRVEILFVVQAVAGLSPVAHLSPCTVSCQVPPAAPAASRTPRHAGYRPSMWAVARLALGAFSSPGTDTAWTIPSAGSDTRSQSRGRAQRSIEGSPGRP
jgi:hypothetical protein